MLTNENTNNTDSGTTANNADKTGEDGRDDIEHVIGRRVENMNSICILGFALCWAATAGLLHVGVSVYPLAYPLPSGLYVLSVLTVDEALGFFIMKIAHEKPIKA